jgi:hypothetical protein
VEVEHDATVINISAMAKNAQPTISGGPFEPPIWISTLQIGIKSTREHRVRIHRTDIMGYIKNQT